MSHPKSTASSSLQSPLGRARGKGSAHDGTHHFIQQRITSVALAILGLWFFSFFATYDLTDQTAMIAWFQSPWHCALMILTLGVSLYHGYLGLQVVIEDYVHCDGIKLTMLIVLKGVFFLLFAAAFYALIKIQIPVMQQMTPIDPAAPLFSMNKD